VFSGTLNPAQSISLAVCRLVASLANLFVNKNCFFCSYYSNVNLFIYFIAKAANAFYCYCHHNL